MFRISSSPTFSFLMPGEAAKSREGRSSLAAVMFPQVQKELEGRPTEEHSSSRMGTGSSAGKAGSRVYTASNSSCRAASASGRLLDGAAVELPLTSEQVDSLRIGASLWSQLCPGYYPQRLQNSLYRQDYLDRSFEHRRPTRDVFNRKQDEMVKYTEQLFRNKHIMRKDGGAMK